MWLSTRTSNEYSNNIFATFIAFPIALYVLFKRSDNMIPFGPFLSIAAIILIISKINIEDIINFITKY